MDMLDQILEKLARSPQDKDIEDRKGTQPKKYYAKDAEGDEMSKSTKQARARHFEKGTKKDDDDPSAYEPAPGDKSAKTKPSQHTKKFKKMFGENYDGDMAQNALENIIRNANNLKRVVKEDGDYPAWWNSKLTKADDYLDVCHDYLMSELSQSEQTIIGEDAVATAKLKAKQADEMERLKQKHEDELEALKGRHDRESERQKSADETERENEKIRKQRETERAKNEDTLPDLDEGKMVAPAHLIIKQVAKEIQKKMEDLYRKRTSDGVKLVNQFARMVGMTVSDKEQKKGTLFLRMGDELSEAVDVKKALSKIKGLTKKQLEVLAGLPQSQLVVIAQQLSGLVMGEEITEKRLADILRQKEKSNQKSHQQRMMKLAKQSIKKNRKEPRLREVLDKNASQQDYIDDFLKSDAPQFKGKSKDKIIKMAVAAYREKQDGRK